MFSVTAKPGLWQQFVSVLQKLKSNKFPYCRKQYLKIPNTLRFYCLAEYDNEQKTVVENSWRERA